MSSSPVSSSSPDKISVLLFQSFVVGPTENYAADFFLGYKQSLTLTFVTVV